MVRELDEQTALGELYLRSLMRSQLRLALTLTALLGITVGSWPLAFRVLPGLASARPGWLHGLPLAWVLLGGVAYPVLWVLAISFVRRAERNERRFRELVDR